MKLLHVVGARPNCMKIAPIMREMALAAALAEPNDDGFLASVPSIQGAFAEGDTVEEAMFNCLDVVKLIAAYRAERKETLGFDTIPSTSNTRRTVALPVGVA